MVLGKKSRGDSSNGSTLVPTDPSVRFTCKADLLGRKVASKKHMFSAEHAEKLIKKHIHKKKNPVSISCMEDRIRFNPDNSTNSPIKHLREYAKYSDIRHIFIYSLSPCLFMLCVEDQERKNKKYYESFRCHVAEDVNRLCELTATAKQNPTNTLTVQRPAMPQQTADNFKPTPKESRDNVYNELRDEDSDDSLTPSTPIKSHPNVPNSEYEQITPDKMMKFQSNAHVYSREEAPTNVTTVGEDEWEGEMEYQSPSINDLVLQRSVAPVLSAAPSQSVRESVHSESLRIVDSRRGSRNLSNQPLIKPRNSECGVYIYYRKLDIRPNPQYGHNEVEKMFGSDVTFLSEDTETGATMSSTGPVFLYALRESDSETDSK
ncbi:hypothetical protein FBUS_09586 [Fasciolopsis buskii]|uniref:Trematode PH-like domain-containing protein n=1 Tax=Fasciolopsis buskii TaxID=27845 RepID=A0A8E0RKE2_9TREM|nr:hypothetical protein FBUS_09586 [Fasciolopsis buski]